MKLLIKTIILLVVVSIVTSSTLKDDDTFLKDVVQTCKNQSSASDSDVRDMIVHAPPTTYPGKCLHSCVLNLLEIMSEEKFVPSKLIELVETGEQQLPHTDGINLKAIIKDIANECKDVTDPDVCESAAKVRICLNAAAKKRDFCPNVF